MNHIFGLRYPFKVFKSIVSFYSIDVVYLFPPVSFTDKCNHDKAMDKPLVQFSIMSRKSYAIIPASNGIRFEDFVGLLYGLSPVSVCD